MQKLSKDTGASCKRQYIVNFRNIEITRMPCLYTDPWIRRTRGEHGRATNRLETHRPGRVQIALGTPANPPKRLRSSMGRTASVRGDVDE